MTTRSETYFKNLSFIGAFLHDSLSEKNGSVKGFEKIAKHTNVKSKSKILEIGCGTGRLLKEIKIQNPDSDLSGIDISRAMLRKAKKRLGKSIHLSVQTIANTNFGNNEFDLIICTSSLYCWNNPSQGLTEIHRILKPGGKAYFYETTREYDPEILNINLQNNLVNAGLMRWFLSPLFLKKQLKESYNKEEYRLLIENSDFKSNYSIENEVLGSLPIYIKMELTKE